MTGSITLPDKYHIVWLDRQFDDPKEYISLKRAIFSHINPQTHQVIPLFKRDRDIGALTALKSEDPAAFKSDHFTLRTFTEVEPCVNYIEQVQNDRILLIASSSLGQRAVQDIMSRYSHSFVNKTNRVKNISIYIFCKNMEYASRWAMEYIEYISVFDNEG